MLFHIIYVFKYRHFKDQALCQTFYSENNACNQIWPNKTYDKKEILADYSPRKFRTEKVFFSYFSTLIFDFKAKFDIKK
jgi:hypothetical protein